MRFMDGIEHGWVNRIICHRLMAALLCLGMAANFAPAVAGSGLPQGEATSNDANPANTNNRSRDFVADNSVTPVAAEGGGAPVTPDATPAMPAASPATAKVFAMVNGKPITVREFRALYDKLMRERFYHGSVPEGQEEALLNDVTEQLVERILLAVLKGSAEAQARH